MIAAVILLVGIDTAHAELLLTNTIGENCVLQRGMDVPVWGTATAGAEVTVAFAGQTKIATADAFGRWQVSLDPMQASAESRPLTVRGDGGSIKVDSVLVGDVFLYISQSFHLNSGPDKVAEADYPPICNQAADLWEHNNHAQRPQDPMERGSWSRYKNPGKYFRNDGYYFGIGLTPETGVPVGALSLGASTLDSLTPPEGFQAMERELGELGTKVAGWVPTTERGKQAYIKRIAEIEKWVERSRRTLDRDEITFEDMPQPPELPGPPENGRGPTTHYNQVAHRYMKYAMRGIVIQPKMFSVGDPLYETKAHALIVGLRKVIGRDVPVCFVQMNSPGRHEINEAEDPNDWIKMRAAQDRLRGIPGVTVLASYDLKAPGKSEPDLGLRAAQWAAAMISGGDVLTGPSYKSHRIDGSRVTIEWSNVGGGLMIGAKEIARPVVAASSSPLAGFELLDGNGEWHAATAEIRGSAVLVTSEVIEGPKAVRYAWKVDALEANLYNKNGFPALPFEASK